MPEHEAYRAIVEAVRRGSLTEPFSEEDFERECPGFSRGTYNTFLWKHRRGNPGGASELFYKVSPGTFVVLRPFKYGLDCQRNASLRGNYEKVLEWCGVTIKEVYEPCGFENEIRTRLHDLTLEWERRKKEAEKEKRKIGGLKVIFYGLMKSSRQAEELAKRYHKDTCHYLRMSLDNGWVRNFCCSMWS